VIVAPPDPRTAASIIAVERALAWYQDEVAHAKAPPLSADEVRGLADALAGRRPWKATQFDQLVTFGQAMYRLARLDASVPDCNLGDALTMLARLPFGAAGGAASPAWIFDPAVDPEAFAKLEFRETSLGISKAQREHREGWWAHAQKNRSFIEKAAAELDHRGVAIVLGAGHAFDLPLLALARSFERLVLVDIDDAALAETAAALAGERGGAAGIETRVMDLTGINGELVRRIDDAFARADTGIAAVEALARLCRSYRLTAPPHIWDGPAPADLVVSSCVLSQLGWPQRTYAQRQYEQRFGPMPADVEPGFAAAWTELGLRVQQDHINALGSAARTVALTSDVLSRPTTWDARSGEKPTGRKIYALGVESLPERAPKQYKSASHAQWTWSRYRASRKGGEGSIMEVEGLVLTEPRTAGGLWLPG
jgi:hypothetical protein